jgi:hypothetical protein
MKKVLFIGLIAVFVASSYTAIAVKSDPVKPKAKKEAATTKKVGPDCKVQYERRCNGGATLVLFPGQVTDQIEAEQFCITNRATCPLKECVARISVLASIAEGSPKLDSCLPTGYRGK